MKNFNNQIIMTEISGVSWVNWNTLTTHLIKSQNQFLWGTNRPSSKIWEKRE